jgi:hypothetical protein
LPELNDVFTNLALSADDGLIDLDSNDVTFLLFCCCSCLVRLFTCLALFYLFLPSQQVILTIDELVDGGMILEMDPNNIVR